MMLSKNLKFKFVLIVWLVFGLVYLYTILLFSNVVEQQEAAVSSKFSNGNKKFGEKDVPIPATFIPPKANTNRNFLNSFDTQRNKWNAKPVEFTAISLTYPSSGLCNELLAFSFALTESRLFKVPFFLSRDWTRFVNDNLDVPYLIKSNPQVVFHPSSAENKNGMIIKDIAAEFSTWCAQKINLDVFSNSILPSKRIVKQAEQVIEHYRANQVETIISVHIRNFEKRSPFERESHTGSFCHEDGFLSRDEYSAKKHYLFSENLMREMREEFGEHDSLFGQKKSLGIFLSTDGQAKNEVDDLFYSNQPLREKYHIKIVNQTRRIGPRLHLLKGNEDGKQELSMLVDMWVSVLADVYWAHPMSSCEGIITQWKKYLNLKTPPAPKSCYAPYLASSEPKEENGLLCQHIVQMFLDEPKKPLDVCSLGLILASAFTKAIHMARTESRRVNFKLYGIWRNFFSRDEFDFEYLRKYLLNENVRLIEPPDDAKPILGRYKSGTFELHFYHIVLNATLELECAAGESLNVLRDAFKMKSQTSFQRVSSPKQKKFCCDKSTRIASACDQFFAHFQVSNDDDECLRCFSLRNDVFYSKASSINKEQRFNCGSVL